MLAPNEHSVSEAVLSSEQQAEPKKKKLHCKWGRWATMVDAKASSALPVLQTEYSVNPSVRDDEMDPALWGELHRFVNVEEMVVANLPLHVFYRALSVCKKWNALGWNRSFLEQWSKTSLPKTYFVLHGDRGCHQAMLVQDTTTAASQWALQPLPPFAFQQPCTSVAQGIVYTGTYENCIRGTVFNMHTKVFRRLPPLQSKSSLSAYSCSSMLAVDKLTGSYKVMVCWGQDGSIDHSLMGITDVYDSSTGTWTRKSDSPAGPGDDGEDHAYCDGVMYIKRETLKLPVTLQPLFAYDFEHDVWTVLARAPHANARLKGLGEWNSILCDMTLDDKSVLRVWEFQLTGIEVETTRSHEQRWVNQFRHRRSGDEWIEVRPDMPPMPAMPAIPARPVLNWLEYEYRRVWVFEQTGYEWVEVDCMPASILEWFLEPYGLQGFLNPPMTKQGIKTSYCKQYILLSHHGFPENSGLARLVLYDMALRSWKALHVSKDWICSCPFSHPKYYPANFDH